MPMVAGPTLFFIALEQGDAFAAQAAGATLVSLMAVAAFALAAASAELWDEGRDLFLRGAIATWVEDARFDPRILAGLRQIAQQEDVANDFRLALALRHLNSNIPFTCRGEIVTPGWLLEHPSLGYELITGPVPSILEQMGGDLWLVRLKARAESIRNRARQYEILLNEEEARIHLLATSRTRLTAQWELRRGLMPDSVHPTLQAILERPQIVEDDLILLLSADIGQFRTAETIVTEASEAAAAVGLSAFDLHAPE
jgi:hypothetical protein